MAYMINSSQYEFFTINGYLILRDVLSPAETTRLQQWAKEVHDLPRTDDSPWMPYEEITASGERVLCRTENYANYHEGFNALLRGDKLSGILSQLAGEEMLLFKEKINYKLPKAGGFAPHLDSTAYTHVKRIPHLSILLAVDASGLSNGCLEVVPGSHFLPVPIDPQTNCINTAWVEDQEWIPVEMKEGQLLVFGSYLAHRSAANGSDRTRRAVYATYNCRSEGDLHAEYYKDRAKLWPATHLRKEGKGYEQGALRYGFGSPMLSVEVGRQVGF